MNLKNIIFHDLETKQGKQKVKIKAREAELPLPDENAINLTEKARNSYKKDSGIAYAKFGYGWLPTKLDQLLNNEVNFYEFSIEGLNELKFRLQEKTLSTGGHLFFILYEDSGIDFLLILLLKDMDGYVINNFEISENHILNLEKLHFAARVNVSLWKSPNNKKAYVSFLKGSGRQDISDYFKKFLSIDENSFNDPRKNTTALVAAIKDYCKKKFPEDKDNYDVRNRVNTEIQKQIKNDKDVTLESISRLVNPEKPEDFSEFLNESNYDIQPSFKANKDRLKGLTKFSGRGDGINISFEIEAIQEKRIVFEPKSENNDNPRLIINDIPLPLLEELKSNLNDYSDE